MFGDLGGLKLPDICLTGEGETPKQTSPRKPVPTGDRTRARCVTGGHAAAQRWTPTSQALHLIHLVNRPWDTGNTRVQLTTYYGVCVGWPARSRECYHRCFSPRTIGSQRSLHMYYVLLNILYSPPHRIRSKCCPIFHHHHHQSLLSKDRSSSANSGTMFVSLLGMNRCG